MSADETPSVDRFSSDLMYRLLVQGVRDYAIYMLDPHGTVMNWNEGAARAKGYDAEEIIGRNYACFHSPADREEGLPERNLALALAQGVFSAEGLRYRKDGSTFWASVTISPIYDSRKALLGFAKITRDLSEQREAVEALAFQARHDALTGISNRAGIIATLERELRLSPPGASLALLYIDLDRFKSINDTFGHETGDAVLAEVAARLVKLARQDTFVARLGGDEFAVLQAGRASDERDARELAGQVIASLNEPLAVGSKSAMIGASVGIAMAPFHGTDSATLIRHADLALYQAKRMGRSRSCVFDHSMNERVLTRGILEMKLRHAIAAEEFEIAYQPLVDARTDRVIGFEALLRWTDQTGKPISPATFVPLAEELGLMTELGTWVLRRACRDAAGWDDSLTIAVNLSPTQLRNEDLIEKVGAILDETGLPADRLELEITETAVLDDWDVAGHILRQLRATGIKITLDDFGTGFSSLSLVRELPLSRIKIDRSFIRDIDDSVRSTGIIRAIVTLSESYGLAITAEGIETEHQKQALLSNGCHHMQGYLFGRPREKDHWRSVTERGGADVDSARGEPPAGRLNLRA